MNHALGNFVVEFAAPIEVVKEQSLKENARFIVHGVAINETTTRNKVKYLGEELLRSAASLKGKPILKDHDRSVDSIVGKVTNSVYQNNRIEFDGEIMDKRIQEMISQGLISSVSIGAQVETMSDDENNPEVQIAHGIEFVELSFVAVPGDENAVLQHNLSTAIAEKWSEVQKSMTDKKEEQTPPMPMQMPMQAPMPSADPLQALGAKVAELEARLVQLEQGKSGEAKPPAQDSVPPKKEEAKPNVTEENKAPSEADKIKALEETVKALSEKNGALEKQLETKLKSKVENTTETAKKDEGFVMNSDGSFYRKTDNKGKFVY
jgi:hypothetical protein